MFIWILQGRAIRTSKRGPKQWNFYTVFRYKELAEACLERTIARHKESQKPNAISWEYRLKCFREWTKKEPEAKNEC